MQTTLLPRLLVAACLAAGHMTVAAETTQVPPSSIESIQVYGNYAIVRYSPAGPTAGCTGAAAPTAVVIEWASDPAKGMLAARLTSHQLGQSIGFGGSGCYTWGTADVPKVYRVDLQ
jgi:hypothetical protein